jgi:putative Holliday junction resolvase
MPRILSIDYGQKRTGIATDEMQIIASGLTTIPFQPRLFFERLFCQRKSRSSTYWNPNK